MYAFIQLSVYGVRHQMFYDCMKIVPFWLFNRSNQPIHLLIVRKRFNHRPLSRARHSIRLHQLRSHWKYQINIFKALRRLCRFECENFNKKIKPMFATWTSSIEQHKSQISFKQCWKCASNITQLIRIDSPNVYQKLLCLAEAAGEIVKRTESETTRVMGTSRGEQRNGRKMRDERRECVGLGPDSIRLE